MAEAAFEGIRGLQTLSFEECCGIRLKKCLWSHPVKLSQVKVPVGLSQECFAIGVNVVAAI